MRKAGLTPRGDILSRGTGKVGPCISSPRTIAEDNPKLPGSNLYHMLPMIEPENGYIATLDPVLG